MRTFCSLWRDKTQEDPQKTADECQKALDVGTWKSYLYCTYSTYTSTYDDIVHSIIYDILYELKAFYMICITFQLITSLEVEVCKKEQEGHYDEAKNTSLLM